MQMVIPDSAVHVVGTSESIAAVQDLEVLPNNTVWIHNSVEPFFIGFGADGVVRTVYGRQGGGPEEFEAPSGFVVGGIEGDAWTFDRQRNALIEVSRPGTARLSKTLPRAAFPPGSVTGGMNLLDNLVRTARLGNEIILPRRSSQMESDVYGYWLSVATADLVALDPATDSARDVIALSDVLGDLTTHFDLTDTYLPVPLWYRLWAVCGDNEIRLHDRVRNELRGFTREGVELEAIALPPVRYAEVTRDEFLRATFFVGVIEAMGEVSSRMNVSAEDSARIMQGLLSRLRAPPAQLANLLPRYLDFRCSNDGTKWLQPFDIERGVLAGGPVWFRITRNGAVQEVRLPERFDPYRFTAERIWGVHRDPFDIASIAWIPVPASR
jgi:hypothetical protein